MTNYAQHLNKPPSQEQLDYLHGLERRLGVSLSPPGSSPEASQKIRALRAMEAPSGEDVDFDLREVREDLAVGSGAVALVQDDEIGGYGSTAHWR